jgi:dipeptidase D
VVIQAHLDMVCEKRPGVTHNFLTDPIQPRIEGGSVYATGTTLGADNGIGVACALATLTQPGLVHGPLELLFTVEEETGLHGAANVDPLLIAGRLLINLDSENPRELTIGCAGGAGTILHFPTAWEVMPAGWRALEVRISGLKGGHSGVQIHERLANALKLLVHALLSLRRDGVEFRLAAVDGGNAHNAIPRDAVAIIALPAASATQAEPLLERIAASLRVGWSAHEPDFALTATPTGTHRMLTADADSRLLTLLDDLSHGVCAMSDLIPGKVETSTNLAVVQTTDEEVEVATSSRSFLAEGLAEVQAEIQRHGDAAGASPEVRDGYPGWEPNPASPLLQTAVASYTRVFGHVPEVNVVHAGLECGVLASQLPGLDAVSFGPTLQGAHTPEEHVDIATVETMWRLLTTLLADLASPKK